MCVRCVFYDDSQPCPCVVLRDAGAGLLPEGVMENLAGRYCMNCFLTCPIFLRVQRQLEAAHNAGTAAASRSSEPRHAGRRRRYRKGGRLRGQKGSEPPNPPGAGAGL